MSAGRGSGGGKQRNGITANEREQDPGLSGGEWNPMAPVNVTEDGRIFRKTRFSSYAGGPWGTEWMWVEVHSLEDRHGILTNEPAFIPNLPPGAVITFRVIPEGEPLDGCAVCVGWLPPPDGWEGDGSPD